MPHSPNPKTNEVQTAQAVDPAAICSPTRVSYSLEEIEARLKEWMIAEFGHPRDYLTEPEQKDKWYRDYGMIYHFLWSQFPANVKILPTREGVGSTETKDDE